MKTKLLIIASILSTTLFAQTSPIWVSPSGSGLEDGSSPSDAMKWVDVYNEIYNRIYIYNEYDFELWLLDGVYTEGGRLHFTDNNVSMVNSIRIFGGFNGSENTVFERDLSTYRSTIELESHVGLHIEGPNFIIVDGLAFTETGMGSDSAALDLIGANTYVSRCRFEKISMNTEDQLLKTENNTNLVTKYINCLVDNCECTAIFGATGDVNVINCTLADNKMDFLNVFWGGDQPQGFTGADLFVYNSIVYDNTYTSTGPFPPNGTTYFFSSGIDALEYWMVDAGSCSYVNPMFSNSLSEPYMLDIYSPYIGYGNTAYITYEPYILQEQDIISAHRYEDSYHTSVDAGAYQVRVVEQEDPDYTTTGFDFDFIFIKYPWRAPECKFTEKLTSPTLCDSPNAYTLTGIKVGTTTNLSTGLYIINGTIQWIP